MKKLFFLLLFLPFAAISQRVYPTLINNCNALVYVPTGADTTQFMNAFIFTPGAGEIGTVQSLLYVHGPFLYAKNGGIDMHTSSLIIAIQNQNPNPRPLEIDGDITEICRRYKINKIILTGLSRGGQNSEWYANDTIRQSNIGKLAALIVFSSQGTVTGYSDAPAPFNASWFAQNGIPILRGEGDQDFTWPQNYSAHTSLRAVAPGLDWWCVWPGVGHGDPVWLDGYNPLPGATTPIYKLLGGKSMYQWGDSVMGNYVPPAPPVALISTDTTGLMLAPSVIRLSGATSTGVITSYSWTQLSGPNTAGNSLIPGNVKDILFWGLIPGSYVFQLTVKDNLGRTSSTSVPVNLLQTVPRSVTGISATINGQSYPIPLQWLKIIYSDGTTN